MERSLPRSVKARNKKMTESRKEKKEEMEKKEREKKFKVCRDEAVTMKLRTNRAHDQPTTPSNTPRPRMRQQTQLAKHVY